MIEYTLCFLVPESPVIQYIDNIYCFNFHNILHELCGLLCMWSSSQAEFDNFFSLPKPGQSGYAFMLLFVLGRMPAHGCRPRIGVPNLEPVVQATTRLPGSTPIRESHVRFAPVCSLFYFTNVLGRLVFHFPNKQGVVYLAIFPEPIAQDQQSPGQGHHRHLQALLYDQPSYPFSQGRA